MIKFVKIGVILLCQLVLLIGCSAQEVKPVVVYKDRVVPVPAVLLKKTSLPDYSQVKMNGDLIEYLMFEYNLALLSCNSDKKAIKDFSERETKNNGTSTD